MEVDRNKGVSQGEGKSDPSKMILGDLAKHVEEKLEVLRGQYDNQLDNLRSELEHIRERPRDDDTDEGGTDRLQEHYKQVQEELGQELTGDQKKKLESVLSEMDKNYQEKITQMHEKHVDEVESQVKAMRTTLEQIYGSQLELARSELDQSHQVALTDLRDTLSKEHKEDMNRLEQDWTARLEDLKQDYDREMREARRDDTYSKEDSQEFITKLNQKLTEEHRDIIKTIEKDLEKESVARDRSPRKQHTSRDAQTEETDGAVGELPTPVIQESQHVEAEVALEKTEDVRKTLDSQYEDIVALRTRMLGEYEQLLSVRTEVMASQSQEVEKLQQEMAAIQKQYEEQMDNFQSKVEAQSEAAMKSRMSEEHAKEVDKLKQFYESKVSEMEDQIRSLQHEAGGLPTPSEKERDYVRKTTMLTAISDTEESPPSSPRRTDVYEVQLKTLEDKLKDRDKLIDELKKRLEAETASAEDLHGQLLDSNNKLCEFEDSLKARSEELDELKAALIEKDSKINSLENEKAEMEEKGEKDGEGNSIAELKRKISKLEEELSVSKEAENKIRQEINQMNSQHLEAIMALKQEMETINKNKIEELESEFKIKLEELDKNGKEIPSKDIDEYDKQKAELDRLRQSEAELREQLESKEDSHEKQMSELTEKYEQKLRDSLVSSTVTLDSRTSTTSIEPDSRTSTIEPDSKTSTLESEIVTELTVVPKTVTREAGSPITSRKTEESGKVDRDVIEAAIRAEILMEYEQSVDKLKTEYEDRITELNTKLQSYETQGAETVSVIESESVPSKVESSIREKLRAELAKEYKEKLQNVTEDYESKLKHLREQIDTKSKESESATSSSKDDEAVPSGSETPVRSPTEKSPSKIPKEYEGFVSTIRKDYEDKIVALQTEIAHYKSSSVPSPLSPKHKEPDSQTVVKEIRLTADAGQDIDPQTVKLRQEIRESVSSEFESTIENLKSDYEKQLEDLNNKLTSLLKDKPEYVEIETKIREELSQEHEEELSSRQNEYESKLSELKEKLEKAASEKTSAEQKVKADMFVWHEELTTQMKKKHEDNIAQINKEYEEKMDLLREEMQEEFDAERDKVIRQHKQDIMDYEDRYENLLEGLRTGDAPDVAAIVQEKFDMELEMAKTLIQQECEETIESEQSRLSEQHEYEIEKLLAEKEEMLEEQSSKFDKDMSDLRNTLLQQYEAQILEMRIDHEAAMKKAKEDFETLVEKAKQEVKEETEEKKEPVREDSKDDVKADIEESEGEDQGPESEESELVRKLRQELQDKEEEYTGKIQELQAVHEEEVSQLMKDLADKDSELEVKLKEVQDKHTAEIAVYQEKVEQLQQDLQQTKVEPTGDDTEALELAHQQELQDVEERLTDKHKKELENLETQLKTRLDDMAEKHQLEVERLRTELLQAQQALDQYPDIQEEVMSPLQAVPTSPKPRSPDQSLDVLDKSESIATDISSAESESESESIDICSPKIPLSPEYEEDKALTVSELEALSYKKKDSQSDSSVKTNGSDKLKTELKTDEDRDDDSTKSQTVKSDELELETGTETDIAKMEQLKDFDDSVEKQGDDVVVIKETGTDTGISKTEQLKDSDSSVDGQEADVMVMKETPKESIRVEETENLQVEDELKSSSFSSISYKSSDESMHYDSHKVLKETKMTKDSKVLRDVRARRESQLSQLSDFESSSSNDSSKEQQTVRVREKATKKETNVDKASKNETKKEPNLDKEESERLSDSSLSTFVSQRSDNDEISDQKGKQLQKKKSKKAKSSASAILEKDVLTTGIKSPKSSSETTGKDSERGRKEHVTCKKSKMPSSSSSEDSSPDRKSPSFEKQDSGKDQGRKLSYSSDFMGESSRDESPKGESGGEKKQANSDKEIRKTKLKVKQKSSPSISSRKSSLEMEELISDTIFLKRSKVDLEMRSLSSSDDEVKSRTFREVKAARKSKMSKDKKSSSGSKDLSDSDLERSEGETKAKVDLDRLEPKSKLVKESGVHRKKPSFESESGSDDPESKTTELSAKLRAKSPSGSSIGKDKLESKKLEQPFSKSLSDSERELDRTKYHIIKESSEQGMVVSSSEAEHGLLEDKLEITNKPSTKLEKEVSDASGLERDIPKLGDLCTEVIKAYTERKQFHAADSSLGSTKESLVSQEDFMVPSHTVSLEMGPDTRSTSLKETEAFEAHSESVDEKLSLQGTLDDTAIQSLDTEQTPRGSLRGVDDTIESAELIHFSEEEDDDDSDKSETVETKTDRSTPTELIQTLAYGTVIGPTVKSLDDTSESSVRVSDREEHSARVKELEGEVEDLRQKLQHELTKQDVQLDRLDREKQEESNLVAMLQLDIERLNNDRETLQNTNEHLLGLLSDAVKTYMNIDDSIGKKLKALMDRPMDRSADQSGGASVDKGRPGSAEGKRTPTRRSPRTSPVERRSPAREDGADGDNVQNTSVVSNITDEGLDLSQRISDSIFQGPDLASEEEELLQDSGTRLQSSVTKLLDMIEESTNQLLDSKQTQAELMETLDNRGNELEQLTSRSTDLDERLREEVERKDFLALELHKAEGLIEGYSSERDQQESKIQDLEDQKENLVLELETIKNKLMDLESTQEENDSLKKEIHDQQELITSNVGEEAQATSVSHSEVVPSDDPALMLEVTRLHSENREKEHHIKQVQDRYESRVRELEHSGEDMEGHYFKLLDEKKQEVADLRMQVDALEKQLKAKKQFIEEQTNERDQEHEDYQKELDKWKKIVQDIDKHNGAESRLQREIDDLSEQLQNRIDLHNQALLAADKHQSEVRDKDLSITELKKIIQQLETEIQDRIQDTETNKQKLEHLEQELSRRPYPDDELSESGKSDQAEDKIAESADFLGLIIGQKADRVGTQISVEDEIRLAADKTKEDVVREKHALQVQVNDLLKQMSGLRNQLDDMRHRTDFSDPSESSKRLEKEREKSEEKDKEISELKLQVENLGEQVENREQQIQQLARHEEKVGGEEEERRFREVDSQFQALKAENKQLRERVQLAGHTSSVTDISGLSQNLLEEKNQEIDHLSEQVTRLQTEYQELQAEKGVERMYDELESLKEELKIKEKEVEELQSVKLSQAFTDHSVTPESSLMNVGASFSEKASILQEMEESEAQRLQRVASLEAELQTMKATLEAKEEEIASLQEQVDSKEDADFLKESIDEKEKLIVELTEQIESLQVEMENLSDFQSKLQEDFDTVQVMLEDKEREIEQLTKELTDKSPESTDDHSLVIKHEVEISRLKKQLREKDNVIEEKMEELAEMSDKVETFEADVEKLKESESEKSEEVVLLKKQLGSALSIAPPPIPLSEDEKDKVIAEKEEQVEKLKQQVETMLGRPPSPPLTEDEKVILIREQKEEIEKLKENVESLLGRPPSPPTSEADKEDMVKQQREEIETLKEQLEAASLGRPPSPPWSEDEKMAIIKQQKLELDTMRKQVDAALQIKPPSPPRSDDDRSEILYQQEQEIASLKRQVAAALQVAPPPPPMTEDEKDRAIERKEEEIVILKRELDKLGEAVSSGGEERLLNEKIQEVLNLNETLTEVRQELTMEQETVKEVTETKDKMIKDRENELEMLQTDVTKLREELQSAKEVRSYEDEIEMKEKEDEIEQLQAELETYRSLQGDLGDSQDSKQLVRSMSFYKEQYEEKCSEMRQLQVSLDLAKEQLEKIKQQQSEDLTDEIELLKVEIEREKKKEIGELHEIRETLEKEREEKEQEIEDLKRELSLVQDRMGVETDNKFKELEQELEAAKDVASKERRDSVQTLKEMEEFRERKEKERKGSQKTIQQLERDLDEKTDIEKKLNKQIKQLTEELAQYKGEEPKSPDSFEMGRDVETLQKQVEVFRKQADRTKEVLAEKQKFQSQVIQLEINYENLQKQMRKGVADLEGHVKALGSQPDHDVWEQLKITQDRLDKTSEQLSETARRLSETEGKLSKVSAELSSREEEMKEAQQDLWKTSGLLSITSGKLQETEEKLRQTVALVTEREDQIHQLQGELQDTEKKPGSPVQDQEVERLRQQLNTRQTELEQVKQSLTEAVNMNEQQLQMTEQKDQEFVKLKLEIQQTIVDKDKTIKEQKQKLKSIEHKEQEMTSKEKQLEKMKLDAQQALATKDRQIGKLREDAAQLQRQLQELRLTPDGAGGDTQTHILQSELKKFQSVVHDKEKEIDEWRQRYEQARRQETESTDTLQNQLRQLQQELQEARATSKDTEPKVRGQGQQGQESETGEGLSEEAEKHMQQLRRELLIAKTALIQIQRGEGFERERSPVEEEAQALVQEVMSRSPDVQRQETLPSGAQRRYEQVSDFPDVQQLQAELQRTREELELYRNSSSLSARDFVQKVMDLKDELSSEHQRHIEDMSTRANQDAETQLAQLRFKYEDEIEQLKKLHGKELEQKLRDQQNTLERKHKGETNKLVLKYQEQIGLLKTRAGADVDTSGLELVERLQDEVASTERLDRQHLGERQDGVGQDRNVVNGHAQPVADGISSKLQTLLQRLHNEGVQVLTISELQYLNRNLSSQELPRNADIESLKAGWENERQSYLSTIQSLKDLLAQTHKLRGLDKDDDEDDDEEDWMASIEGSDWRAELLRAIGYVFSKEREALLAELRSHVLSHPDANLDEVQRLEQKIRNQESHHHSALDQIFSADRQSMLAEIRDLRAHATISRMHHQEERERLNEKLANAEDHGSKKERQLKRQDTDEEEEADQSSSGSDYKGTSECQTVWIQIRTDILSVLLWVQTVCKGYQQTTKVTTSMERVLLPYMYFKDLPVNSFTEAIDLMTAGVQLLEFKIQQEKVLQDDLRTSLDAERSRSGTLSGQLNQEKSSNLDLQSNLSSLQVQIGKLKETLEREQSRFVSVTNALEEEKSKSLNLSELLESERQTLYRVQSELEALRQSQESLPNIRHLEELQAELSNERERRCQAESRHEIDRVTMQNLRQEVEMEKRHQQAIQKEYDAKTQQLLRHIENEKQKVMELDSALDREHGLNVKLRQSFEAAKSQQEATDREKAMIEDLKLQLETETIKVKDLSNALQREQRSSKEAMSSADAEKRLLQEHLDQEREVNHHLKHDLDALQIEKLEAVNKYEKEVDHVTRLKAEKDQMNEELKNLRTLEIQRDRDREAERLSDKKATREADREKEEYRMKLHEQELETQRLTQKCLSFEEQVAELQENELKAIRELEQEKLRALQLQEEAQEKETQIPTPQSETSEAADGEDDRKERWQVYRSQLESMCQSLHYLVLRCREQLSRSSHGIKSHSDVTDFDVLHSSLRDLLNEVKQLQEIEGDFMSQPAGTVNERILRHNEELTNFVARSSEEKNELRNTLSKLEEEIWRYRQKDAKYQEMQRASSRADESQVAERANWAKERLSLQMSLNVAEREIDQLQTDLRVERERRVASGITDTKETDKVKIQRLYGKYLRAESFRKALIYQKKYLLLLLGGFQDTEETTLALLARMGATPAIESLHYRQYKLPPITTFRSAVRVVIAITRMKYLVRKWKRATRVGSEVVGGSVDIVNGYMPDSGSYSPPRHPSSPRFTSGIRSASPPSRSLYHSPPRSSEPVFSSSRSQLEIDTFLPSSYPLSRGFTGQVHTTPPTKDYTSTTRYTSPSSGARRKILTTPQTQLSRPSRVRFTPQDEMNGDFGSHDDYINRLENLQSRLGALQSGKRATWKQPWR